MVTNNIKWVAQTIAPNPIEIDYWIDLKSDPNGSVIRYYKDNKWVDLLNSGEQELTDLIKQFNELKEQVNSIQDTNTVYTFKNGNGSFTVTPSEGSAQTVSIGKPATAGTADIANSVAWDNVSGKPSTYTPSTHTHTASQITDFPELSTVASSGSYDDLTDKPTIPSYTNATTTAAGLMSNTDKQKLDSVETDANHYVLPTASAGTLGGVKIGSGISVASDGTINLTNKTAVVTELPASPDTNTIYFVTGE